MKKLLLAVLIAFTGGWLLYSCQGEKTKAYLHPPVDELYLNPLPAGSVTPDGWMYEQMRLDIEKGLAGSYERIWPSVGYNLFVKQERTPGSASVPGARVERREPAWWAGEHEGYWKDALVRLAFLTGNKEFQERAKTWMQEIVAAAKKNGGYIGIYKPDARFPKTGPDGELWAQSRIFQAMLAYYEFTGDKEVLEAVENATLLNLKAFKDDQGTYFGRPKTDRDGGASHGIGFLDTLEWLYRITGKQEYRDGLVWFFNDYSNNSVRDDDLQLAALLDSTKVFRTHTPHIMEGLHGPQMVASLKGGNEYQHAAAMTLHKLAYHTSPSGNFVGDELVRGLMATGETLGEYCSMTEGVSSLNKIVAWGGTFEAAELIEKTTFNAAQAARFHPDNIAVQYLGRDNQYAANDTVFLNGRTVYAGFHKAAACCTLNSTRILSYYVDGMWYALPDDAGLFAMLFGPSELKTLVKGVEVTVKEETMYPFEDQVVFHIDPDKAVDFKLMIRIPDGAGDVKVEAGDGATIEKTEKYITIERRWKDAQQVKVDFNFAPRIEKALDNSLYVAHGPLVFSLPVPANVEVRTELQLKSGEGRSGFYEYTITPKVEEDFWNLSLRSDNQFEVVEVEGQDRLNPWGAPPVQLRGKLIDANGVEKEAVLKPHGSSVLRRLTFPEAKSL